MGGSNKHKKLCECKRGWKKIGNKSARGNTGGDEIK